MQQTGRDVAVRRKMEEMRMACEREIPIQQQRIDAAKASFKASLGSITTKSHQTLQFQAKVGKLKAELREIEDALVKALAVKTRKEVKRIAVMDSLSVTRARIEELKGIVEDQRSRKDEYEAIITQQSEVLHCDPNLKDTKELVNELNRSNGLFKFVRTVREKFQESAASGICSQDTFDSQDTSIISLSAPVSSVSSDCKSEYLTEQDQLQLNESNRQTKKVNRGKVGKQGVLSPRSALSLRRSPRVKAKK